MESVPASSRPTRHCKPGRGHLQPATLIFGWTLRLVRVLLVMTLSPGSGIPCHASPLSRAAVNMSSQRSSVTEIATTLDPFPSSNLSALSASKPVHRQPNASRLLVTKSLAPRQIQGPFDVRMFHTKTCPARSQHKTLLFAFVQYESTAIMAAVTEMLNGDGHAIFLHPSSDSDTCRPNQQRSVCQVELVRHPIANLTSDWKLLLVHDGQKLVFQNVSCPPRAAVHDRIFPTEIPTCNLPENSTPRRRNITQTFFSISWKRQGRAFKMKPWHKQQVVIATPHNGLFLLALLDVKKKQRRPRKHERYWRRKPECVAFTLSKTVS